MPAVAADARPGASGLTHRWVKRGRRQRGPRARAGEKGAGGSAPSFTCFAQITANSTALEHPRLLVAEESEVTAAAIAITPLWVEQALAHQERQRRRRENPLLPVEQEYRRLVGDILGQGSVGLIPLITESAGAVLNAASFTRLPARVRGLTWGAEDLAADVGALGNRPPDGEFEFTYAYARSMCLLAAAAAGVAGDRHGGHRDSRRRGGRATRARFAAAGLRRQDGDPPGAGRADPCGVHAHRRQRWNGRGRVLAAFSAPRRAQARSRSTAACSTGRTSARPSASWQRRLAADEHAQGDINRERASRVASIEPRRIRRPTSRSTARLPLELRELVGKVKQGGSAAARAQHESRGQDVRARPRSTACSTRARRSSRSASSRDTTSTATGSPPAASSPASAASAASSA